MYLRLMTSRFCVIWARMHHFEVRLMVLSQEVDSKVLRMATVKVCALTSDFKLWFGVKGYHNYKDILNPILLTLLTFIALQILRNVLICCALLLFSVCHYVNYVHVTPRRVNPINVSKSWVGMSINNINLFRFKNQGH